MKRLTLLTACWLGWAAAAPALTVRVDPAGGAPRITVNGAPVRARMFWGAPGSGRLAVTTNWQQFQFEFVAEASATNGTIHFRLGQQPGDLFLDEIQIIATEGNQKLLPLCDFEGGEQAFSRDWTYWPPGAQNTTATLTTSRGAGRNGSGGVRISLRAPADGRWPDFHIYCRPRLSIHKDHLYRVSFWARSSAPRPLVVAVYRPGQSFLRLGGPPGVFEQQLKLAAAVGVNFVSFPIPMPWPKPGEATDWTPVDAEFEKILRVNPQALLLPRMGMDPPRWWRDAYPEEVMRWENGAADHGAVVASARYRRDAADRLAALIRHLEEAFGEHVAGYHPCGQNTGEWFYHDTWGNLLNGYAPADQRAWRAWLQEKYASEAALQSAWGRPGITFATVAVPAAGERHAAPAGIFRDPARERHLIDWARFQQDAMAECVSELAHAARQASRDRKLVVFFYGYVFEFGAVRTGPAVSGHYALRRVLNCPDIDVLCSPISYFDRGLGEGAPSMTAAESVALAGKLWLNEDDTHTYLATGDQPGSRDHVNTLEESREQLARNVAQAALRNFGTWWMDLGGTGWFNDPALWTVMDQLRALDQAQLRQPRPFAPEVAAVLDERNLPLVSQGGTTVAGPALYEARRALGRMGAPYGQYLLDDVLRGSLNPKLYVFLNAWRLAAGERERLGRATRGTTRLWCYAPGYFDDYRPSLAAMQQLTGFKHGLVSPAKAWAVPTEAGRRRGLQTPCGVQQAVQPLFAATDATADETLAAYPDGSAAIALRRSPGGASLFVGVPGLTSELLRLAAREAHVHLFTQTDCNVYASGPFLVMHASRDGLVRVEPSRRGQVLDLLSGKTLSATPGLELSLKRGETRLLRLGQPPAK